MGVMMQDYVSPSTGAALRERDGVLVSASGERFPIVGGIPRFVPDDSYAAGFGLEWTLHSATQLDSRTGTRITRERLERCLGHPVEQLKGLEVLEAGCGAGRFTELLVGAGANVHAVDLSVAVDANRGNIGERPNYKIAQADITRLPFAENSFDLVLCLGVLQHTPSPEATLGSLWSRLRPGGALVIDHYTWNLSYVTKLAPLVRQALIRMPPRTARKCTDALVDVFFPLHWRVREQPIAQALLSRVSPCLVYFRKYVDLTKEQHLDLARLDTFDSLTDRYKHFRTVPQIRRALEQLGATGISVARGGNGVEARARKVGAARAPAVGKQPITRSDGDRPFP